MPFPDLDRLQSTLLTSGLQNKDSALFQVIKSLIDFNRQLQDFSINQIATLFPSGVLPVASGGTGNFTFTAGSVIFATGSGGSLKLTQDNANFFWNNTNKRLGIGTNTPVTTVEIKNASGTGLTITQTGTGNSAINLVRSGGTASDWIIYLKPATTSLAFFTGADRVTFDSAGLITASSLTLFTVLTIGTNAAAAGTIRLPNNVTGITARNAANTADAGVLTVDAADNLVVGFSNVADVIFKPANVEQARIVVGAGIRIVAGGALFWNGRAVLLSPANAQITLTNQAQSSGFGVQMGTADTMIVANKAQNAYGTVDALRYKFSNTSRILSSSDGVLRLSDAAETSFNRLQFGGTTSSFPSLKRSSAELIARLADDSADAVLQALRISTNNAATFHTSRATLTDGAGVATGTLNTSPTAGNPTKWIGIDDNGTTRYIPAW